MSEQTENTYEIPFEWDHLPTEADLRPFLNLAPGVTYLWCLVKNLGHAKREGYQYIRLMNEGGRVVGQVTPLQVGLHSIILLGKGKPIRNASRGDCAIVWKIDPELGDLLKIPASGDLTPALSAVKPVPAKAAARA